MRKSYFKPHHTLPLALLSKQIVQQIMENTKILEQYVNHELYIAT